jgi:hypothetical protein
MGLTYPKAFPLPTAGGLTAVIDAGIVRTDTATDQVQRRVYNTMPHSFTMTFVMDLVEFNYWYEWILNYGFRWFDILLPTVYAGLANSDLSPVTVRVQGPIQTSFLANNVVQAEFTAETAPGMIVKYLAVT